MLEPHGLEDAGDVWNSVRRSLLSGQQFARTFVVDVGLGQRESNVPSTAQCLKSPNPRLEATATDNDDGLCCRRQNGDVLGGACETEQSSRPVLISALRLAHHVCLPVSLPRLQRHFSGCSVETCCRRAVIALDKNVLCGHLPTPVSSESCVSIEHERCQTKCKPTRFLMAISLICKCISLFQRRFCFALACCLAMQQQAAWTRGTDTLDPRLCNDNVLQQSAVMPHIISHDPYK